MPRDAIAHGDNWPCPTHAAATVAVASSVHDRIQRRQQARRAAQDQALAGALRTEVMGTGGFYSDRQWHSTGIYTEVLHPAGVEKELLIPLPAPSGCLTDRQGERSARDT